MLITTLQTSMASKYSEVKFLIDKESKRDPKSEPYKSYYKAIEILKDMKELLHCKMALNDNGNDEFTEVKLMLSIVYFTLGKTSSNTDELVTAAKYFKKCLDLIAKQPLHPDTILLMISALNELGVIWFQRDDAKYSRVHLEEAEILYKEYTAVYPKDVPVIDWIFHNSSTDELAERTLDATYALTTFYLAQVYKALDLHLRAVLYCHITLKKQLEFGDLDKLDWATNAATLSQFFIEINCFKEARHYLAAASAIIRKYESDLQFETCTEEEMAAKVELMNRRSADVSRCWVKYGLLLMSLSKKRLISEDTESFFKILDVETVLKDAEILEKEDLKMADLNQLHFDKFDTSFYENKVIYNYILTFDDARKLFLIMQQHIVSAKKYYTLDTHASDMIQITQDHSQLYRNLCFFEEDDARQIIMLKKRLYLLEPLQGKLNAKYYIDSCREIWYEMGQINHDIFDVKMNIMEVRTENSKSSIRKANSYCDNSVKFFLKFLDSFKDKDDKMPLKFEDDMARPCLNAYFTVARVYQKRICSSPEDIKFNNKHSLIYYTQFIDYCDRNEKTKKEMRIEYSLCRDMKRLLPLKIDKFLPK